MRASRLVNLLLLLQTRGSLRAADLADELEVSVRTIHRDVDELSAAGVPIYAERGPHGGIRLVDGYRTRLTGLTGDEADALFLSGMPGPAAELGLGTVVAATRLKVLAALPAELRARASRITERFYLDAPGWFQTPDEVPHLAAIAQAVWESRRSRLHYRRADRVVLREVEPLGIVLKGGTWYLVAHCDGHERTYRISRVVEFTVGEDRFERPDGFDLAAFWTDSIAAFEREAPRTEAVLRLAPDASEALADALGVRAADAALAAAEPDRDGWLRVSISFEWPDEAVTCALRLGSRAELIEPDTLRRAVIASAGGILARYQGAAGRREPLPAAVRRHDLVPGAEPEPASTASWVDHTAG
jgi:predicted DNA-binding transcriptional regulator YafY